MNKADVVELFKFLNAVYPNFDVNQIKINVWTNLLGDQNPAIIMRNAERHAMSSKFPPNPAELRETRTESNSNSFLTKLEAWEREASASQH